MIEHVKISRKGDKIDSYNLTKIIQDSLLLLCLPPTFSDWDGLNWSMQKTLESCTEYFRCIFTLKKYLNFMAKKKMVDRHEDLKKELEVDVQGQSIEEIYK